MLSYKYMIVGGGMVAGYAAKALVERGLEAGELVIISADNALPYERPPLSKGFLAGRETEDSILIGAPEFYRKHGIEVRLSTVVERLHPAIKVVRVHPGDEIRFERLLIATGARVRTLDVPGAGLEGVHYLRSLDDSRRIRYESESAKRAVVIGGGFIAMEVCSVLAQRGIETTMVLAEDRIWRRLFTPAMSAFFRRYYEERGVRFETQARVTALDGDGRVESVSLSNGRQLPADLVVAGIGVLPVTDVFENSGLKIENGIVVNEFLETGIPGIWAAGDVANYRDVLFGVQRRVEHWDNAVKQGQHAAKVLTGEREPFENVPYFFSDDFDLSWEFWGDSARADRDVVRGEMNSGSFSVWWLEQGRVVAAFVMNRPDEEREVAPEWIRARREVSPEALADAARPLR